MESKFEHMAINIVILKQSKAKKHKPVDLESKYLKEKSLLAVRMKPIGKGETDQFQ